MKTFTIAQAISILEENFKGYKILKKWDTIRELCIVFLDAKGQKWELFSNGEDYFQHGEDFVIYQTK